ncbi:MAG: N-acetyltransferase [Proteobacteria bacterium]|nr:N-acetyltransferase [Desulfobulbaceae bacterium]MBU4152433.1 N-acetyltransferase [Pseudomonadota bacterium]MDP2105634.1 N-acetyltransferase [Desulfobulbaceae bacterium]
MIRNATMGDIKEIHSLLSHFAAQGQLLGRALSALYDQLRDFKVFVAHDQAATTGVSSGIVAGSAALHVCWENLAEIRSLAVLERFQGQDIGTSLVRSCLDEADTLGITKVFTLTYQPGFFKKLGFHEIDKNELPHKVWSDCINCPKFPDCNETALVWQR